MGWELWGFFGVEGLDTRIYGEILGKNLREREGLPPPIPRSQNRDLGHPILLLTSDLGHPPGYGAPDFVTQFRPGPPAQNRTAKVCVLPGAQMRGTWGTQIQWL